jgi:phosphoglycolate phosphatase-like HAD superfamily hydrolase
MVPPAPPSRLPLLVACDIDGTLIDTTPSFTRIVHELSGATTDDITLFRAHGGFNDDWELARAAKAWIAAGRPRILERCAGVADVVTWCGHDPGDLAPQGIALYRGGYHKDEIPLVDAALLQAVEACADVVAVTGRDAWEYARAEELLDFRFAKKTTAEDARKPDPAALLRLVEDQHAHVVLLGDTGADRRCVENARVARAGVGFHFYLCDDERRARTLLEALCACATPAEAAHALTRLCA